MKSETWFSETIINELDFLRKTAIIQWSIRKKIFFFATKSIEKIPDRRNDKEHYQSFIRMKNTKSKKKKFWKSFFEQKKCKNSLSNSIIFVSLFIIYADFESILVPEKKWKAKSGIVLYKQISKIYCLQLWL